MQSRLTRKNNLKKNENQEKKMLTEGKIFGNIILAVSKLEMEQTLPFASVAV